MSILVDLINPYVRAIYLRLRHQNEDCPVCQKLCHPFAKVNFNKSCEELRGSFLPPSNCMVLYCRCTNCGFCFSPKIARWSLAEFAQRIYNKDYVHIDPDYLQTRPLANAEALIAMFMGRDFSFNHLDYGGGSGLLSQTLSNSGWVSKSYDPFVDRELNVDQLGIFDLVTAYEVFEHVPDPRALMENLSRLTKTDGIILFSTLISDGEIEPYGTLSWWYAAPRNGHISLFSLRSLTLLAAEYGFHFGSFTNGYHVMWRTVPSWASRIFNNLPAKTGN